MRTSAPIKVNLYLPQREVGRQELARRVAGVHADAVVAKVKSLPCSNEQKQGLVDAILQQRGE